MAGPSYGKRIRSFAGPFKVVVNKWYKCSQQKPTEKMWIYFRPSHLMSPRELQRFSGNMTMLEPITDANAIFVRMDLWSGNQWKLNAFHFKFPAKGCSALKSNIPDVMRGVFQQDPYTKGQCNIPEARIRDHVIFIAYNTVSIQREYILNNEAINWTFPNFPVMPYGTYRVELALFTKEVLKLCTAVECVINPQA